MKIPAVAMAASFAGGILLGMGQRCPFSRTSGAFLLGLLALAALLLVAGFVLAWREWVWTAGTLLLVTWVGLGVIAGGVAKQPLSKEHVLSRLAGGEIPARTAAMVRSAEERAGTHALGI